MKKTSEHGFIALISIIILSVSLLVVVLSLAQFGIASRFFILDMENKNVSEKLADGCVHIARIQVYNDPEFEEPNTVKIGAGSCRIMNIQKETPHSNESTITVQASSSRSVINFVVVVDTADGEIVSWTEVP